jgi:hypothetical protein
MVGDSAVACPNNDCSVFNRNYTGQYGGSYSLVAGVMA